MIRPLAILLLCTSPLSAVLIPTGTELNIRLTDKIATETTRPQTPVHADLIAPVIEDGKVVLPLGVQLTGEVKRIKPAADPTADKPRAQLQLDFTQAAMGNYGTNLSAIVSGLDNARETVDADGIITGIDGTEAYGSRLDQGIAKLQNNDKFASLAGLIQGAKQVLKIQAVNPNIDYDPGVELTVKLTRPLDWRGPVLGIESARALIEDRGYKEGPMSILFLGNQPPSFALQKGNNTFAQRHHLRIFARRAAFDGKPVWLCSSTHDTGIDFSERDHTFIHKIDPDIDKERAKVASDLLFAGAVRSMALVDRPEIPANLTNATGDPLHTDGRMLVLLLK